MSGRARRASPTGRRWRDRGASLALASGAALALACAGLPGPVTRITEPLGLSTPSEEMTQSELHAELAEFSARFGSVMGTLGEQVTSDGADEDVQRRALLLRVQLVPLVQQHALDRDPRAGYVALLSLAVMLRRHAAAENGHLDFGRHQPEFEEAARQLEDELVELGRRFLERERLERLRDEIEQFARDHQPSGGFVARQVEGSLVQAKSSPRLGWILGLPMTPFRALAGVEQGPAAIREFTQTARGFASIVATLPLQLRWQADLLVHEALRADETAAALDALARIATSAQRLSAASDRLPEDLTSALERSEAPLDALATTLGEVRELLAPLRSTAREIAAAGTAWAAVTAEGDGSRRAQGDGSRRAQGDGSRRADAAAGATQEEPDLAAWRRTASQIGETAARIEAAARSLDALTKGQGPEGRSFDERLRALVDVVALRIGMLLVLLFALVLLLRVLTARLTARRPRGTGTTRA